MYYSFTKNVYLVEGAVNACIYDLNLKKLFAVNSDMCWALRELICENRILHDSFRPVIEQLERMNIITPTGTLQGMRNITELGEKKKLINQAWIEVTTSCNLRCIHCYEESSPYCDKTMSLEDFKHVITELRESGVKFIQLIGGEPLILNEKLVEMITYARNVGDFTQIQIFTNATLVNEKWIEIFHKNKLNVLLSLYSYDEQNHDNVTTVRGSFQKTMSAIKLLQENHIPHQIACTVMKGVNLGVQPDNICISKQDIVRMTGRASKNLLDRKLARQKLIIKESFINPLNTDLIIRRVTQNTCFSTKVFIDTQLDVYPCVMERRLKHGNMRNESLEKVLKDEIINLNKDCIQGCQECEYRYACSDCRPDSFSTDVYCKPWYCTYNLNEGKWEDPEQFLDKLGF